MNNLLDILNFLRKLSFIKILNIFKILLSYNLSKLLNKIIVFGRPHTLTIEPTNICNLSCPECPAGQKNLNREIGNLNIELYKKIIAESYKTTANLILYFQGEPLIHKSFIELIKIANKHNIYTTTSTNAQLLTNDFAKQIVQSGLDKIIISMDGTTQETYQSYRVGGNLQSVVDAIKHINQWKKTLNKNTPFIICQFLILKQNEHQINEAKELSLKSGANKIVFKTAQFYNYKNGNTRIPENKKYTRYTKTKDNSYSIKFRNLKLCFRLWSNIVITWNGNVNLCCFDKDSEFSVGSIINNSLFDIWKGSSLNKYRTTFISKTNKPNICSNCTNGINTYVKI